MTLLRKTSPKITILGITLTILALGSGTVLSERPAPADSGDVPVQPADAAPQEAPAPPVTLNG
ncbi:MAG: hypothetical protein R3E98_07275 [Gemmatimonadota bacterium]